MWEEKTKVKTEREVETKLSEEGNTLQECEWQITNLWRLQILLNVLIIIWWTYVNDLKHVVIWAVFNET